MFKLLIRSLLTLFYRVELKGFENYLAAGKRVLIVANHTSFLDALLLGSFLRDPMSFVINTQISRRWLPRLVRPFVNMFVLDPTRPLSLKTLIRYMQQDNKVVIFPEGRITVTGALMKIYDGPGMVADRSGATILPVHIHGAQYTPFSRLRGRVRLRWFPKINLTILPARTICAPPEVRGRARRKYAGQEITHIMTDMMFATSNYRRTIMQGIIDAQRIHGADHFVLEDIERRPLSYRQLLMRAFIVGNKIRSQHTPGEIVGVLMPNAVATVLVFLGLQIYGRVPAMLNVTSGMQGVLAACRMARIKIVYTSRRFITMASLTEMTEVLAGQVTVVYLEDLIPHITAWDRLCGYLNARFARTAYVKKSANAKPDDPSVLLFTAGTEGQPKGVMLSHANLLANGIQFSSQIDFSSQDIIFSALPMYHAFGLMAGTLLPLLSGMRAFCYPTLSHYRIVPEMIYEVNATVIFGNNALLKAYAQFAHPYDFYSVRYVYAGAEPVEAETRRLWSARFGVRIFECYGATETASVLAANTPMENKPGTVGRLLPGLKFKLMPITRVSGGERLLVSGPNVMLGYVLPDQPGKLQTVKDNWYDTGDIISMDEDGYVTFIGRASRLLNMQNNMN